MEDIHHHTTPKKSWSKLIARKWLSLKNRHSDFHSDCLIAERTRRKSCSDGNRYLVVPDNFSDWATESDDQKHVFQSSKLDSSRNLKMFVGTWNVGGKSPPKDLDLKSFLQIPTDPADIYVLGFQEIVPLNAGNVLGAEDSGPTDEWLSLIRRTLNSNSVLDDDEATTPDNEFENFCDFNLEKMGSGDHDHPKYCLAASKQMVGLFLCVWVRSELVEEVDDIKVSCVGRGIMGCLGNKGSVSVSMKLYNTSFCFVCTHLASGEKEGNEVRRNLDVLEILRKTRFGRSYKDGILDHDNVIWLGDLNYRLACDRDETHELLKMNDWQTLLEKDQLRIQQRAGRVFNGFKEGTIRFAPTYKYLPDSDQYVSQSSTSKEKPRTPAWCDRILWRGDGLKQMTYDRDETRFSDHRPVFSTFRVCIDDNVARFKHVRKTEQIKSGTLNSCSSFSNSIRVGRIRAEELFILSRGHSCVTDRDDLSK